VKIALLTNYVVVANNPGDRTVDNYHAESVRFVQSYRQFTPNIPHDFVLLAYAGPLPEAALNTYSTLPHRVIQYNGEGRFEGAFLEAAKQLAGYDLMACVLGSVHFHRPGWLERFIEARLALGNRLFGAFGSYEDHPHLRSCCLVGAPEIFLNYPYPVFDKNSAHEFEHRDRCFTAWATESGYQPTVVTWDGFYTQGDWDKIQNGYRRGDQSNCLMHDHVCDHYTNADEGRRSQLTSTAFDLSSALPDQG